ncbi:MAG: phospho-sugar mutase [Mycobacteriaceae bacterium]
MTFSDKQVEERVAQWIVNDPDPATRNELAECSKEELAQRFSATLTFGTAGLRGPIQAGPMGMNLAVVIRTSAGIVRVLADRCLSGGKIIVGYDARHRSAEFAQAAAEVFTAEGFSVTLFSEPLPTPVLAFAVQKTKAVAGIQITASHNPATDNGYKVYFFGGAQIISPTDREIETATAKMPGAVHIPRVPVESVDTGLMDQYVDSVVALADSSAKNLRIAFTALHGVGGKTAMKVFAATGFTDVHTVSSQFSPDPRFPTVAFPNPEEPGTTQELIDLAESIDANIAIAFDPDADRCAVGVPDKGRWRMLSGDETGILIGEYLLRNSPPASVVSSTIVSSRMLSALAESRGVTHVETLTGFKWLVRASESHLLYAYEEALGYCVDPQSVRDKDGISAAVMICKIAAELHTQNHTLIDELDRLAVEFGVYQTSHVSQRFANANSITALLESIRAQAPTTLAGFSIGMEDLLLRRGQQRTNALILMGNSGDSSVRIIFRPSGTEPKLKCYIEVHEPVQDKNDLNRARQIATITSSTIENYLVDLVKSFQGLH